MKAGLISDIRIHRIYFCRQEGEIRNRILHHFSAHKRQCMRWRTPRAFVCKRESRQRDGEVDEDGRRGDVESLFRHGNPRVGGMSKEQEARITGRTTRRSGNNTVSLN